MKKSWLALMLCMLLCFTGCSSDTTEEIKFGEDLTYQYIISFPLKQHIGMEKDKVIKEDLPEEIMDVAPGWISRDDLPVPESDEMVYVNCKMKEFLPYYLFGEDGIIYGTGYEVVKEEKFDELYEYVHGLRNILIAYYGEPKTDSTLDNAMSKLTDASQLTVGAEYFEVWTKDSAKIELKISLKDNKATVRMEYKNK